MMLRQRITSWFLLLLAALTLLIFWPLYTGQYTLRGEATDILIPVFSHIRETLFQGDWPMWNKYQQQGMATSVQPMYWNPIFLITGALFSSPHLALNAVYLLMLFIGGLGFYLVSSLILEDHRLAAIGGLCYPLVGFFVVQGQYMDLISAASWAPLLLYFTWQYWEQGKSQYLWYLAIGYFLFTTSTSFGFVLAMTAAVVAGLLYKHFIQGLPLYRSLYTMSILFGAGFLVWRISWIRWTTYVPIPDKDGQGISILDNLLDISSLFVSSSSVLTYHTKEVIETIHFHSYTGILILLLSFTTIIAQRTKKDVKLFISILIFFGLSLVSTLFEGSHTEVSGIYSMPIAAIMKILMVGSLLILGLNGLKKVVSETKKWRTYLVIAALTIIGIIFILKGTIITDMSHGVISWFFQLDLLKTIVFLLCVISILWIRPRKLRFYLFAGLIIAELGLSNYLNQDIALYNEKPSSTFSSQISFPEQMRSRVDLSNPTGLFTDKEFEIASLDQNTGTLYKKMVRDGYTSWETKMRHEKKTTENWKKQLRYPLFYFSKDTSIFSKPSYTNFDDPIIIRSQKDHQWDLSLNTTYEKYLIFNQNFDKNWKAYIDSDLIPITKTGTGMMKIPISPGLHTVSLTYHTDGLLHIFSVTMIVFSILIVIMAAKGTFPFTVLVVLFPVMVLFFTNIGQQPPEKEEFITLKQHQDTSFFEFTYENHSPFWFFRSWQITPENSFSGYRSESLDQEAEYSATLQLHREALKNKKELYYEFRFYSKEPIETGVVLKTYTETDESYNINYITSLNTGQWKTIIGRFPLHELEDPIVKADFYIWNYQKKDFLIDDIKVKLIP